IKGQIFTFLDDSSVRTMRATSVNDRKIVESYPLFSEADKKTIRAVRELFEKQAEYQNLPNWQVWLAHLVDPNGPLSFINDIIKTIFPFVNTILHLEKEIPEIAEDLVISHFFGTRQEFASID